MRKNLNMYLWKSYAQWRAAKRQEAGRPLGGPLYAAQRVASSCLLTTRAAAADACSPRLQPPDTQRVPVGRTKHLSAAVLTFVCLAET